MVNIYKWVQPYFWPYLGEILTFLYLFFILFVLRRIYGDES